MAEEEADEYYDEEYDEEEEFPKQSSRSIQKQMKSIVSQKSIKQQASKKSLV